MNVILTVSNRKNKKYRVSIESINLDIHFGDNRYQDFTIHKNEQRKLNYINRHRGNENWNNYYTAGFWSRWLLWNKPTLKESIIDIKNRFSINVIYTR